MVSLDHLLLRESPARTSCQTQCASCEIARGLLVTLPGGEESDHFALPLGEGARLLQSFCFKELLRDDGGKPGRKVVPSLQRSLDRRVQFPIGIRL